MVPRATIAMASTLDDDFILEESDQEEDQGEAITPDTPGTPASAAASPRKKSKSRGKYLACPYDGCDKTFNRPARLEEHKRSHTNDRIFKCNEPGCAKDFLRNTHLKRHIEANHTDGPKTYLCKYEGCDQSFVTNQRLKRHHAVHEKRDKYRCTEPGCDETFRKHNTLDQHIRTVHQGEAAFPCDEVLEDGTLCTRGFGNAYYLKLHKGRDHGAKSYFCTICPEGPDSSFGTFSGLQAHNKIMHPPTCQTCGFQGRTAKEIANHVEKMHSGQTLASRQKNICPFPECNSQGFVEKRSLKVHIRTVHENQKPYQCGDANLSLNHVEGWDISTACGKAFSHKATLQNHIRSIHMGLDSMIKRPPKRKADLSPDAELSNSSQSKKKNKRNSKASKLDLLTGTGMTADARRTLACPILGCDFRFIREWDKVLHLHSRHGVPMEDNWIMTSNMDEEVGHVNDDDDDNDYDYDYDGAGAAMVATRLLDTRPVELNPAQYASVEEELEAQARLGRQFWLGGLDQDDTLQFNPFYGDFGALMAESDGEGDGGEDVDVDVDVEGSEGYLARRDSEVLLDPALL